MAPSISLRRATPSLSSSSNKRKVIRASTVRCALFVTVILCSLTFWGLILSWGVKNAVLTEETSRGAQIRSAGLQQQLQTTRRQQQQQQQTPQSKHELVSDTDGTDINNPIPPPKATIAYAVSLTSCGKKPPPPARAVTPPTPPSTKVPRS
eukprot:g12670.t1 g12670   contig6:2389176-2389628(+)